MRDPVSRFFLPLVRITTLEANAKEGPSFAEVTMTNESHQSTAETCPSNHVSCVVVAAFIGISSKKYLYSLMIMIHRHPQRRPMTNLLMELSAS